MAEVSFEANGRQVIKKYNVPWGHDRMYVMLLAGTNLAGGNLSVEVSPLPDADPAQNTHWCKVDGLETLAVDRAYSTDKFLTGFTIALNLTGATAPTFKAYYG